MAEQHPPIRIGVVGSGFIARHFVHMAAGQPDASVERVLTRRDPATCTEFPRQDLLTNSLEELVEQCEVVLECSGDPIYATDVVAAAVEAGRPVVTMNAEFHVTSGSYFAGRGLVTEAEGDQPGCQAALHREALAMGFRPLVYGNMKGFLNHTPTPEEMEYWGAKQGISLPMVTSFTDGTKLQIEQALVANGLGATIARRGLLGFREDDLKAGASQLAAAARETGAPISDYLLSGALPHGVFVVAEHDEEQRAALEYIKMGPGPDYTLVRQNILVHLEILKTVREAVREGTVLLDNSASPAVSVATVAKHDLAPGTRIERGIGSFDVRGECVLIAQEAGHVPVGLLADAVVRRPVEAGAILRFDDIELPESLALTAWQETERRVLGAVPAPAGGR